MGKNDAVSKKYLSRNDVFADAINYHFFGGQQVIRSERLKEQSPEELSLLFGKRGNESDGSRGRGREREPVLEQRYRDVLKKCVIRSCGKTLYMIYGIEAQSEIHYAMPVRSMLYDAMNYASQVSEIAAEHRKEGDHGTSGGEFLSGFHKADRLHPVQTLVIYFGSKPWDGPRSLKEMLDLPEGMEKTFLNDYRLDLLVPEEIEDFTKFHTQLGPVLEVMKVMEDRGKMAELMEKKSEVYARLPRDAAELIRVFAKIDIELREEEEEINMCKAIDDMMAEAREIGRAEGREEGRESLIKSLFRRGVSFEMVSGCALQEGFTEDKLREIWESASRDVLPVDADAVIVYNQDERKSAEGGKSVECGSIFLK